MSRAAGHLAPSDVLHLVVPAAVDDPGRPSGGNVYDRELVRALRSLGHDIRVHRVGDGHVDPLDPPADALDAVLASLPDRATVLVDGLFGLGVPDVLPGIRRRLRVWLLVHLPLALATAGPAVRDREQAVLTAAAGAVVTSGWTRDWLVATYGLDPARVHVARPGVHPTRPATASPGGGALLCVGAVTPAKGQDLLLGALATLPDLAWSCRLVGPLDRDPAFVDRLRHRLVDDGLAARVSFTGPLGRTAVDEAMATADLLVLPSRLETFGMVTTEALAHGVPVVASRTGGVVEAVGATPDGRVPGLLVPPEDSRALAAALRRWLEHASWRSQLRAAANLRRARLPAWSHTAREVRRALGGTPVNRGSAPDVVRAWT